MEASQCFSFMCKDDTCLLPVPLNDGHNQDEQQSSDMTSRQVNFAATHPPAVLHGTTCAEGLLLG